MKTFVGKVLVLDLTCQAGWKVRLDSCSNLLLHIDHLCLNKHTPRTTLFKKTIGQNTFLSELKSVILKIINLKVDFSNATSLFKKREELSIDLIAVAHPR